MVKNAGRIAALGLLSLLSDSVVAQSERSAPEEYASIVKKGQDISALGTSLFGDQTALYSGNHHVRCRHHEQAVHAWHPVQRRDLSLYRLQISRTGLHQHRLLGVE